VLRAKVRAQQIGHQDQHLITKQVAVAVIDQLEVVNINHRQPGLDFGHVLSLGGVGKAVQMLVKSFAVEQPGQSIALAVIKQALVVLVHLKNGQQNIQIVRGKLSRLGNFNAHPGLFAHPDR